MAMRHGPAFEPGKEWGHSNTNYVLAGMIIERVTGGPWQQRMHERIIEPLGLRGTILQGTGAYLPSPRLAAYKRLSPGGPLVDVSTYASGHPDGSMISTTADVNRFLSALLGGRLLRPAQLKEMRATEPVPGYEEVWPGFGYGLGIMERRLPCGGSVWFHAGGGWNADTDNGVTADGRRAATVAIASSLEPGQSPEKRMRTSAALIDRALCSER